MLLPYCFFLLVTERKQNYFVTILDISIYCDEKNKHLHSVCDITHMFVKDCSEAWSSGLLLTATYSQ